MFLESNPKLKDLFGKNFNIPSYRRSKILKKKLALSKFASTTSQNTNSLAGGCFKCDKNRCNLCKNYFVQSRDFSSFKTEKSHTIGPNLTCDSKNVIYIWYLAKNSNFSTLAQQQQQNSEWDSETINHLWSQKRNLVAVAVHFNSTPHPHQDFSF